MSQAPFDPNQSPDPATSSQRRSSHLLKAVSKVGGLTMISRVLGLIRDIVFANFFGSGSAFDAFLVAFKIPNFFRRLFAEGAFSQAFVPLLAGVSTAEDPLAMRRFVLRVALALGLAISIIVLPAMLMPEAVVSVFAPGFKDDPQRWALTASLLQITLPYLLLISLAGLWGSVLNNAGIFGPPALAPVLLNVCFIVASVWAQGWFDHGVYALAYALMIAGFLQLGLQVYVVRQKSLIAPAPTGSPISWSARLQSLAVWRDPDVRRVLTLMAPAILGVSVAQLNLLIDMLLASFLVKGSVSWLYYADRLMELPLGVIGIALGTVLLPTLSSLYIKQDLPAFSDTLGWGVKLVLVLGLPSALGLWVLAEPIIAVLFHRGAFTYDSVLQTALGLRAYAWGVVGFMLIKVLAPGFFRT